MNHLFSFLDSIQRRFVRVINIPGIHKKIVWHQRVPCDILIWDEEGSNTISNCIPSEARVFILKVRNGVPAITSISFVLWLFFGVAKYRKAGRAMQFAIIRCLKPKLIITFIDNSPTIGVIKKMFPALPMIAVQNGTRWDLSQPSKPQLQLDHYFSFGSVEKDILSQSGDTAAQIYSIGSLRMGLFEEKYPIPSINDFDICYISQYSPLIEEIDRWNQEMLAAYFETEKIIFNLAVDFVERNGLSLCVAMRHSMESEHYQEELQYFSSQSKAVVHYIPKNHFSSYKAVRGSRLSLTISSTLGYEALGLGERVIFAKDIKSVASIVMQGPWAINLVTHRLPELQRLYTLNYIEFSHKALALLKMTDVDYRELSNDARIYYMNYDSGNKPHEIVRSKIREALSKGH